MHPTVARKGVQPRVRVAEDEGQRALMVDGVVQSVAVEGPTFRGPGRLACDAPRRPTAAGAPAGPRRGHRCAPTGAGASGRCQSSGWSADPDAPALARAQFGLDLLTLTVVEGDAFEYVANCDERFDYVAINPRTAAQSYRAPPWPVLSCARSRSCCCPGGQIYFNLFKDGRTARRLHRAAPGIPLGRNAGDRKERRGAVSGPLRAGERRVTPPAPLAPPVARGPAPRRPRGGSCAGPATTGRAPGGRSPVACLRAGARLARPRPPRARRRGGWAASRRAASRRRPPPHGDDRPARTPSACTAAARRSARATEGVERRRDHAPDGMLRGASSRT